MSKSRILIIGKIPPPYLGTSVWFDELRNSSLAIHFDVTWFNVNVNDELSSIGSFSLKKIYKNLALYFRYLRIVKNVKPELVLVPISQSTIGFIKDSLFIWFSKKRCRTLIILHGSNLENWLQNSGRLTNRYFTLTLRGSFGAIVLGKKLKYLFKPWFSENRIFVLPNGLDMSVPERNAKTDTSLIIRYIGSLSFNKGVDVLVEAINHLKNYHSRFRLVLNGIWRDSKLKHDIECIIEEKRLPVFYEGEVTGKEKALAYLNTDIFVFTPVSPEGHPMVIIEAMASGLPIISTDMGAISESVIDGVNGYIVKEKDPVEIAQKLECLIDNPDLRIKMGVESRRIYTEKFTTEKMTDRYREVFINVLNDK